MFTEGMVKNFHQSAHMEDCGVVIGRKSGLKDVSVWDISMALISINVDTKASEKLTTLLNNPTHLKDMTRLSSAYQTSSLESFHNVVINFAPKSIAFS